MINFDKGNPLNIPYLKEKLEVKKAVDAKGGITPFKATDEGYLAAYEQKVVGTKPHSETHPEPAKGGILPNIGSAAKFIGFGMGGGALITAAQMFRGEKLTATDTLLTQAATSTMGLPLAAVSYTGLRDSASSHGVTGAPEIGVPSVAPSGQTPLPGEISFNVIAPPTIGGAISGGVGEVGKGLGLPDFGDLGKLALIAGVGIAGIYIVGKMIGRKRG